LHESNRKWSDLNAPSILSNHSEKRYDKVRRKKAHLLGLDFLFCPKEVLRSVQADRNGEHKLVTSLKNGKIVAEKPLPGKFARPLDWKKFYSTRTNLGIQGVSARVSKLGRLLHCLTQCKVTPQAFKLVRRLSLVWYHIRYLHLRKMVNKVVTLCDPEGLSRNQDGLLSYRSIPTFTGRVLTCAYTGYAAPLWGRRPLVDRPWGISLPKGREVRR
jgi:hypothetical protein